jgi:hypothetical protein
MGYLSSQRVISHKQHRFPFSTPTPVKCVHFFTPLSIGQQTDRIKVRGTDWNRSKVSDCTKMKSHVMMSTNIAYDARLQGHSVFTMRSLKYASKGELQANNSGCEH